MGTDVPLAHALCLGFAGGRVVPSVALWDVRLTRSGALCVLQLSLGFHANRFLAQLVLKKVRACLQEP